jgi:hypothetical protein
MLGIDMLTHALSRLRVNQSATAVRCRNQSECRESRRKDSERHQAEPLRFRMSGSPGMGSSAENPAHAQLHRRHSATHHTDGVQKASGCNGKAQRASKRQRQAPQTTSGLRVDRLVLVRQRSSCTGRSRIPLAGPLRFARSIAPSPPHPLGSPTARTRFSSFDHSLAVILTHAVSSAMSHRCRRVVDRELRS